MTRIHLIIILGCSICIPCAAGTNAGGRRVSRGSEKADKVSLRVHLRDATGDELAAICREVLQQLERSSDPKKLEDLHRDMTDMILLMRIRKQSIGDGVIFREVLSHRSLPDHIREAAAQGFFRYQAGRDAAKEYLRGDDDLLRAAALDLLAHTRTDPATEHTIEKMVIEINDYTQTATGVSLTWIRQMHHIRTAYLAEKSIAKKVNVLMTSLPLMYDGKRVRGKMYVRKNAFAQYLLARFKEAYLEDRDLVVASVNKLIERGPAWAPVIQFVLELLDKTTIAGENAKGLGVPVGE